MLTRGGLTHQYGFAGYYAAPPYHVVMLADAYPVEGRTVMARYYQVPLNEAVAASGTAALRPYAGMDPSDPGTWSRPYDPQQGMFARLHEDQAKARGTEPPRRRGKRATRG